MIVLKKFIFKDTEKNTETVLPVTPPSFEVSHGINVETINIHTLGDVNLPGYGTLATIKIDCTFPAQKYNFVQAGAKIDPYGYVKKFKNWSDNHTILRFIVSDTSVNIPVFVQEITYGERDGTEDVYASITLREHRELTVIQTKKTGNSTRKSEKRSVSIQNYTIKKGDTLSAICRKYYGDSSLYKKLASYNNIKNPNLIIAGKTIKLPDKSLL